MNLKFMNPSKDLRGNWGEFEWNSNTKTIYRWEFWDIITKWVLGETKEKKVAAGGGGDVWRRKISEVKKKKQIEIWQENMKVH